MSSQNKPLPSAPPVVDEWGIYDPDRAGLAALFEKLDARPQAASRDEAMQIASSMREAQQLTDRK